METLEDMSKKMEIPSNELQIHSSKSKLSRFRNFERGSTSKLAIDGRSSFVEEMPGDSLFEHENCIHKLQAMSEKKQESFLYNAEVTLSNDRLLLEVSRASTSNKLLENCWRSESCLCSRHRKELLRDYEVERLNQRIKIFEEETNTTKRTFFRCLDERKRLVTEIYQQFERIRHSLHLKNQVREEKSHDGSFIITTSKDGGRRAGLSLLLSEDSTPCVAIKCIKS